MQRLSVEQVAILKLLKELEEGISVEFDTNREYVKLVCIREAWDIEEIEPIVEELQYWGYVDTDWNVTIPGRQYLKTGPENATSINITNDFSKNYDVTLFEKLIDVTGIKVDRLANFSMIENLTTLFAKFKLQ